MRAKVRVMSGLQAQKTLDLTKNLVEVDAGSERLRAKKTGYHLDFEDDHLSLVKRALVHVDCKDVADLELVLDPEIGSEVSPTVPRSMIGDILSV